MEIFNAFKSRIAQRSIKILNNQINKRNGICNQVSENPMNQVCRYGTYWDFIMLDSTTEQGRQRLLELDEKIKEHPDLNELLRFMIFRTRSIILRDYLNLTRYKRNNVISIQRAQHESLLFTKFEKASELMLKYGIQMDYEQRKYFTDHYKRLIFRKLPDYQITRKLAPHEMVYDINYFKL